VILIAGGTGRLGTALVTLLAGRGQAVRVLTRDPARAAHLGAAPAEIVTGDVRDPASLAAAVRGAEVVVSAVHGFAGPGGVSPATVDHQGNINLINAAQAAGAGFVLMSVVGAAAGSPSELLRMKHAAEQYLRASGISWTIVRATAFGELWIELLSQTAARSGRPIVFGAGTNPVNFVSVTDVAALAGHAITDPAARGQILEIGGPADLTLNQLAAMVQAAAGRTSAPRHVPAAVLRLVACTIGRVKPELGRQARAALLMDQADLSHDATAIHRACPGLPSTPMDKCLRAPRPRAHVTGPAPDRVK
jgi:uncharacterized protein YbjT (DUF2867 family)